MKYFQILTILSVVSIFSLNNCSSAPSTSTSVGGDGYISNVKVERLAQDNEGCKITKADGSEIDLGSTNGCMKISLDYKNPAGNEEGNITCDPDSIGSPTYNATKHMSSYLIGKKASSSTFNDYGIGNLNPVNFDPYYAIFVNPGSATPWDETDSVNTLQVKTQNLAISIRSSCSTDASTGAVTINHIIPILPAATTDPAVDDIGVLAAAKFSTLGIQIFANGTGDESKDDYESRAYIVELSDRGTDITTGTVHYMGGMLYKGSERSAYNTPANGYRFSSTGIGRDTSKSDQPYIFWGVNADTSAGEIMSKDQSGNTITY